MTHARRFASITGTGSYLPERILTNCELEAMVDTSDEWILSRTGIAERRIVAPDEATSDLAAEAGRKALADARIAPADLDLIIVGTSSPDLIFPSTACITQRLLGAECPAYDVMAACTGFVFALQAGTAAIESGRADTVLVIGADALTRHVDFTDRTTCVLFGDGAGAVVLQTTEEPGVLSIVLGSDGRGGDHLSIPAGGSRKPAASFSPESGEHFLKMNGNEVFKFAVRAIPKVTRQALAASNLSVQDLDWLIPHQANQRILDTVEERLGIDHSRVFSNLRYTGNTSAASIPIAIDELNSAGKLLAGANIALVGFGAGLTWGAAIVRWTAPPRLKGN
ncbi:MAG: ketoacyl-ACP synthase III [Actinobacteria bacterium]|nr:ketoacyl-ACP synthase III [Actinomycetota bacterium]MCL5887019.1 ketoacyl-ACP synthase III [Actinomycetota bacterium]